MTAAQSRIVAPQKVRPARMAPLTQLPVFLNLAERSVLVAGSGEPMAWKAELLLAAGARITLAVAHPDAELRAVIDAYPGRVSLLDRSWREQDFEGAALAVLATESDGEAQKFADCARACGVSVNVIDRPAFCDFQFGAIVNRSPVIVAIGTDGAAPVLAQAIRRKIEALLPDGLGAWAALARKFRERLAHLVPDRNERRRFWERFTDACFSKPAPADEQPLIDMLDAEDKAHAVGEVILVGAGPGDASLMTFAGMRALQRADVVIYDHLVTEEVLELSRREARRVLAGKKGHGLGCRQEDISALMVEEAEAGRVVVRLKGGDPAIFSRAGEELAACRERDIPVRIVPGITSASAAAAAFGVPLTHRDHGRRLQFISGHDRNGGLPDDLDLDALADRTATTCIYMPMKTLPKLARKLLAKNVPASMPIVLARAVGRQQEAFEMTSVGAVAVATTLPDADMPVLAIMGTVVASKECDQVMPAALQQLGVFTFMQTSLAGGSA